ncbi:FeoA family protein [Ezakiella peruensis]|uniref:FeoA family protein n=1 Tax=Ezakiella peruensis TaxID=1464038 RepID=UPI000C1B1726|nr:FeoA domain-containing protein [Ezakiella peruensis]
MKTLRQAEVGKSYRVLKIHGAGPVRKRIMDMGLTKNSELFVRKVAPLGDPIQINLRNYELSLRKDEAEIIEVEEIQGGAHVN